MATMAISARMSAYSASPWPSSSSRRTIERAKAVNMFSTAAITSLSGKQPGPGLRVQRSANVALPPDSRLR